jgi:signal peptidase I
LLRAVNIGLTLVLAVVWWNLYRPQPFGGPAAYAVVEGNSMEPAFNDGDLVITREHSSYHAGEVIAFRVPDDAPGAGLRVIHRIVARTASGAYITKGDNNRGSLDPWRPSDRDVIGSVAVHVPHAGTVVNFLRQPPVFAWFVGSIVLVGFWTIDRRRRQDATRRS